MSAGWACLSQGKSQGISLHKADLPGTCRRVFALRTMTPGEQGTDDAGPSLTQEPLRDRRFPLFLRVFEACCLLLSPFLLPFKKILHFFT